jgi:hypothetical protein
MAEKSETKAEYIAVVKTVQDVQFLGINGKQIAASMAGGLELKEFPKGIQVTSKAHAGKRIVIYNANIASVEYREVEQ